MPEKIWFLILMLLNAIIALLFYILQRKREEEKEKENQHLESLKIRTSIILLCPGAGILFLLTSYLFQHLLMHKSVDLSDVMFSKEMMKTAMHADEERDRNMAPLEEALVVSDKHGLRRLLLDVLKGDVKESLTVIALALNSEDSETAHYAASVLQEVLNEFRIRIQKMRLELIKLEENEADEQEANDCYQMIVEIIPYMNSVLEQRVFTDMEQKGFVKQMDSVCEMLYVGKREWMKVSMYEAVSSRLLDIDEYERASIWGNRAMEEYPDDLSSYVSILRLLFKTGDREEFFKVLEQLKATDIVIDQEILEIIRVMSN